MIISIGRITVNLENERNGIRLITDNEDYFIPNQTIDETLKIMEINFQIVKEYFKTKTGCIVTETDPNTLHKEPSF